MLRFLDWVDTERLVVAGDLFEDPRLRGLEGAHARAYEALREFSLFRSLVWLNGNHDPSITWCREVLGIEAHDEWLGEFGDRRYLVCHGHRWDAALQLPAAIIAAADGVYHACQFLDPTHRLARRLKRGSKSFCRVVEALHRRAIKEAQRRALAGVILGHSHVACDTCAGDVHYLNSGCWTERPAGFIGVRDGVPRRYFWEAALRCSLRAAERIKSRFTTAAVEPRLRVAPVGGGV